MKSLALFSLTVLLISLTVLLICAWPAASSAEETQYIGGHPSPLVGRRNAEIAAVPAQALLTPQRPGGECAAIVARCEGQHPRGLPWHHGTDYKLRIIEPPQRVDCKIVCIRPDPNLDYKLRVLDPGGHQVSAAPLAPPRRTIIIDPHRRGRRK